MSRSGWRVLGFVVGLIGGYCAVLFGWLAYSELAGVHDMDGGKIMNIAFAFAPAGAVVAAIILAVAFGRFASRRGGA